MVKTMMHTIVTITKVKTMMPMAFMTMMLTMLPHGWIPSGGSYQFRGELCDQTINDCDDDGDGGDD